MSRRVRVALMAGGVLVTLAGLYVGARVSRGAFTTPVEIKPGLWGVRSQTAWLYLLRMDSKIVVFDAGADPEARPVDALLSVARAPRADVAMWFVSHGHADHIAGLARLPGVPVNAGAADAELIEGRAAPEGLRRRLLAGLFPVPSAKVTSELNGATEVVVSEGHRVKCVPAPGHTPGSYVYLAEGALFVGDALHFDGTRLVAPPAWFSTRTEGNQAAMRSLANALAGAEIDLVCTGHGGCTPRGEGRRLFNAFFAGLPGG